VNEAATPTPAPGQEVGSLAVDPGDGTLLIGSSAGAFRVPAGAAKAEKFATTLTTPANGSGPLFDLILRASGPHALLASGHPRGGTLPVNVGLVASSDAGKSWRPVSGLNDADYHDVEVQGSLVVALRNDDPNYVSVSTDGGAKFEQRAAPAVAAALDITIDPGDAKQWAVGTEQGTFLSTNEGRSWRQRDTTSKARVAWAAPDKLYSAGLDGKVRLSSDQGKSWDEVGTIGAGPLDFVAGPDGALYAYLSGGKVVKSADGGSTWSPLASLR